MLNHYYFYNATSGHNVSAQLTNNSGLLLSWEHPPFLYYSFNNDTNNTEEVSLVYATDCNCVNITGTEVAR